MNSSRTLLEQMSEPVPIFTARRVLFVLLVLTLLFAAFGIMLFALGSWFESHQLESPMYASRGLRLQFAGIGWLLLSILTGGLTTLLFTLKVLRDRVLNRMTKT